MRVLLRILAPLLGLAVAAAGALLAVEVALAWLRPTAGPLLPWPAWRAALEEATWRDAVVPAVGTGVAVLGLALLAVALRAGRGDVPLTGPAPEVTVTATPRALARLVGTRVRAADDVAAATVTASRRRVRVRAETWGEPTPATRTAVAGRVGTVLDDLAPARRPRVGVTVLARKGPR